MAEIYSTLRVKPETKKRFALHGHYRATADEVLRELLDKVETCRCRPLSKVMR